MQNSIRQMFRTPVKTAVFLLLVALSVALLFVGLTLWFHASMNLQKADDAFVTIGTVQQKENTIRTKAFWDADRQGYLYRSEPVYDSYIPLETLLMDGVKYNSGPEQRPFYGGMVTDPIVIDENEENRTGISVVEFVPVNDCIPSQPVEVEVVNVLYGIDLFKGNLQGQHIQFYDRYTETPGLLERGKTYIASIWFDSMNDRQYKNMDRYETIYAPHPIYTGQTSLWEEVTDGFYDTAGGVRWQSYAYALDRFLFKTVPVTPTQDTQLLPVFHKGDAAIAAGRDIRPEEYAAGANVCMISQAFGDLNHLAVGDTLRLGLYDANYQFTAVQVFGYGSRVLATGSFLNPGGAPYAVFQESGYRIVGIYSYLFPGGAPSGYELSPNEIIVPMQSITHSDQNNIVATGPMQGKNTSFRIPNGTSDAFLEAFSRLPESGMLEIQFYDNGYAAFASGLQTVRLFGLVLFCVGLFASAAVICLLLYFYIIKQRKRTAVERALGMSGKQCIVSLMAGILLLSALGAAAGCAAGASVGSAVQERILAEDGYFNEKYSRGLVNQTITETDIDTTINSHSNLALCACIVAGMVLLVFFVSLIFIRMNLRVAPIRLLNAKSSE